MVNIAELKKGDTVHYKAKSGKIENGIVKSVAPNGGVFVVYNCAEQWQRFENYTSVFTNPEDLYLGWSEDAINK